MESASSNSCTNLWHKGIDLGLAQYWILGGRTEIVPLAPTLLSWKEAGPCRKLKKKHEYYSESTPSIGMIIYRFSDWYESQLLFCKLYCGHYSRSYLSHPRNGGITSSGTTLQVLQDFYQFERNILYYMSRTEEQFK